jgi:hypothetical protein
MTRTKDAPWVKAGGKAGELGHCGRCGKGLAMDLPQSVEVVTAAMKAFAKVHSRCADTGRTEPRPMSPREWMQSRDTGTSSLTIFSVITGIPSPHGHYDVPHDPDDFSRCYRLLKLFPDWVNLLPSVAIKMPNWKPFVENWPKLTEMYEKALPSTGHVYWQEMYDFMRELRGK